MLKQEEIVEFLLLMSWSVFFDELIDKNVYHIERLLEKKRQHVCIKFFFKGGPLYRAVDASF